MKFRCFEFGIQKMCLNFKIQMQFTSCHCLCMFGVDISLILSCLMWYMPLVENHPVKDTEKNTEIIVVFKNLNFYRLQFFYYSMVLPIIKVMFAQFKRLALSSYLYLPLLYDKCFEVEVLLSIWMNGY